MISVCDHGGLTLHVQIPRDSMWGYRSADPLIDRKDVPDASSSNLDLWKDIISNLKKKRII